MIYKPFHINPEFVNRTSTNWPGGFTERTVPYSSLSNLVPGSNVLAASASTLKGVTASKGTASKGNASKKNIRLYNRMAKSKKNYRGRKSGYSKIIKRRISKSRRRRSMKGGHGHNTSWHKGDWITGNALNYTNYSSPIKLPPTLSALANPVPFFNNSRLL